MLLGPVRGPVPRTAYDPACGTRPDASSRTRGVVVTVRPAGAGAGTDGSGSGRAGGVARCFTLRFRWGWNAVPAGIRWPRMTFSFRPIRLSTAPARAASVSTLVVSWNDAALMKLSLWSEALVMPRSSVLARAGRGFLAFA